MSSDIVGRIWEHKKGIYENSFTKRYHVNDLVYHEYFETIEQAIDREKQLKGWNRTRKINLIQNLNPSMKDLFTEEFTRENYKS